MTFQTKAFPWEISPLGRIYVMEFSELNYNRKSGAFYTCFTEEVVLKQLFTSGSEIRGVDIHQ